MENISCPLLTSGVRVSWDDSRVYVDLSREAVKNGPEYRPEALNRTYEEMFYNYYKRPKYWDR
jgi:hypothetical protein